MDKRFQPFLELPRQDLDFQLSPSKSAKDAAGVLERMIAATQSASADPALLVSKDLPYGPGPRERFDVFRPADRFEDALPCVVFLHGGFWQEGDKSVSGFAAKTFAALGWAYVSVGYTLTPEVTLTELTAQAHAAVDGIVAQADALGIDPARIILVGHSAGAHLAASVIADVLSLGKHRQVAGAVLISGVYELAPIAASYVNDLTRMTDQEVRSLSPARFAPVEGIPLHLLIGSDEPDAFQVQTRTLKLLWSTSADDMTVDVAKGRDHFDVLEELNRPTSPTVQAVLTMGLRPSG